jgi:hypothetical protein
MNTVLTTFRRALLLSCACGVALGQPPPPAPAPSAPAAKSSAQIDAGEPRANSVASPADATATPGATGTEGAAPASPRAAAASATAPVPSRSATKAASASHAPGGTATDAGSAAAAPKGATAADRLNLNTATVTGDREQPKVMYIVPWKSSNIGDLSGKPMNSLLDEALAPVDREEFKREVAYYDAVRADVPQNGASPPAAKQGEK